MTKTWADLLGAGGKPLTISLTPLIKFSAPPKFRFTPPILSCVKSLTLNPSKKFAQWCCLHSTRNFSTPPNNENPPLDENLWQVHGKN